MGTRDDPCGSGRPSRRCHAGPAPLRPPPALTRELALEVDEARRLAAEQVEGAVGVERPDLWGGGEGG